MTASFYELDRVILEAVSDDYQSFESVVRKISHIYRGNFGVLDIERMLLSFMANKLVAAYLIHADPPYATEVRADLATIQRYWFWITEEGQHHLGRRGPLSRYASM